MVKKGIVMLTAIFVLLLIVFFGGPIVFLAAAGLAVFAPIIVIVLLFFLLALGISGGVFDGLENKSKSHDYLPSRYKNDSVIAGSNLDRFFMECVLAKCDDFSIQSNTLKAEGLARKYNLKYTSGIDSLYQMAMNNHKRIVSNYSELRNAAEILDLREKYERFQIYRNLSHNVDKQEKTRIMLTDMLADIGNQDIATDVKIAKIDCLQKELENARDLKIVYKDREVDQSGLFGLLTIGEPSIQVFSDYKDGKHRDIVHVEVTVRAKEEQLFVDGNIPAMIDGYLRVNIYNDQRRVSDMELILPAMGVSSSQTVKAIGIIFVNKYADAGRSITYSARLSRRHYLWIREI